jgi:FkbH-like protein
VWDYAGLVQLRGTSCWTDDRLWHLARQPIAAANLPYAASHLSRTIAGTIFQRAKCLVLDLDNTLWGGAAGDDGISGIQIGDDYPGNVFKAFQNAVLGLKDRGVLLAIASKNDEAPVKQIFDEHPDMVIRWDDFSITRVNWNAKSESLKEIAAELNIGIDALAFFDDNPVEREEVRLHAPEVSVINVPKSPLDFVDSVFASGLFDDTALSAEDADRTHHYQSESRRKEFRESAASMDDFLTGLKMEVTLDSVGPETIARATQLIGKTNQFNLTTRRYSQNSLQRMVDDSAYDVRWVRLSDRYGDSGIVGLTIICFDSKVAIIDSFVMSCRVMNRKVEQAMLCDAVDRAKSRNCTSMRGSYIATKRNAIVSGFYMESGFAEAGGEEGEKTYVLDLSGTKVRPEWPAVLRRKQC